MFDFLDQACFLPKLIKWYEEKNLFAVEHFIGFVEQIFTVDRFSASFVELNFYP